MRLRNLLAGAALAVASIVSPRVSQAYQMEDMIGAVHDAGVYYFGSLDYMDEGANQIAALGTHRIKVEMAIYSLLNDSGNTDANYQPNGKYQWNSNWAALTGSWSITTIAQQPYFTNLWKNANGTNFNYYVITAYCPNISGDGTEYWLNNGVSPVPAADLSKETSQFQALATYYLQNYSNDTFVLENWEGDWAIRDGPGRNVNGANGGHNAPITLNEVNNMISWFNARAAGVHAAMALYGPNGSVSHSTSNVYVACEVSDVHDAITESGHGGNPAYTLTDDVLPNTTVDIASYSSYDTEKQTSGTTSFANAVAWMASHCPSTAIHGKTLGSIGIGEVGVAENQNGQEDGVETQTVINNELPQLITNWPNGVQYMMYWDIFDNDLTNSKETPPSDTNGNDASVTGYWMIKPDGTPSTAWHLYRWQCITTDPVRYSTTNIKAGLTNVFTSNFQSGHALPAGFSTNGAFPGNYSFTVNTGNLAVQTTNIGSGWPLGLIDCNLPTAWSGGRGLNPGEYAEYTIDRTSAGFVGTQLFNSSTASASASGSVAWQVYAGSTYGWIPISWNWNVPESSTTEGNPTYSFTTTPTLGISLDSADGTFATVSFYINGSYSGSWLYQTTAKTLNDIDYLVQDDVVGDKFYFGNLAVYEK